MVADIEQSESACTGLVLKSRSRNYVEFVLDHVSKQTVQSFHQTKCVQE